MKNEDGLDHITKEISRIFIENEFFTIHKIALIGSKLDDSTVDFWSDTDLIIVLHPEAVLARSSIEKIISNIGQTIGKEVYHSNDLIKERLIVLSDNRIERIDLQVISYKHWEGVKSKVLSQFKIIYKASISIVENRESFSLNLEDVGGASEWVNKIWFLFFEAVKKFMRNDNLIGLHLLLELLKEYLVILMQERDVEYKTNIHRIGGNETLPEEIELQQINYHDKQLILRYIEQLSIKFEDKMNSSVENYKSRIKVFRTYLGQCKEESKRSIKQGLKKQVRSISIIFMTLICLFSALACSPDKEKIIIILDTDFGGDADDLGALAMLNHFQNKGEIELAAVMAWNTERYSVSAIDAVNTYYGNPDILIGRRAGEAEEIPWNHSKAIADRLAHNATFDNVPEATALYRQILSESEDHSLVIVTVGPLMNIKKLIDSPADDFSPLSGKELIYAKVKEFVVMGGQFPEGEKEWNFDGDMKGVTKYVLSNIETPITFLGFELGASLKTGEVFNELSKDSPLYLGFYHFSQYAPWTKDQFKDRIHDNATFDQTAVLYAVRNGVGSYWTRVEDGFCQADETGGNTWVPKKDSNHSYLVLKKPIADMEEELEALMLGAF